MKLLLKTALMCLTLFFSQASQAVEIAGVKIDESISVASSPLKLNGAGIRTKVFFKVYIAALYLTESKTTAEGVFESPGPKQINLTMLREMKSDVLSQAFNEGVKKNTPPAELDKLSNQFSQLDQLFATIPELKEGDVISIAWLPNVGTVVSMNGKKLGEKFPDVAFFNALLRIWLGNDPVSSSLKSELLKGAVSEAKN